MTQPDDEHDEDLSRRRTNLLAAGAFLVIALLGGGLVYAVHENLAMQKCELEGRRDCAPIDIPRGN